MPPGGFKDATGGRERELARLALLPKRERDKDLVRDSAFKDAKDANRASWGDVASLRSYSKRSFSLAPWSTKAALAACSKRQTRWRTRRNVRVYGVSLACGVPCPTGVR